ncbi:cation transport protein ChaC [Paraburkholderia caballeronis]|nr:cation transport protein ChaC [Paraburkholderia caballeronis]
MSMLNRDALCSGAYLRSFESLPTGLLWTQERIDRSLAQTLAARPDAGDVWVFGYGSLIWNPLAEIERREAATLHGWHRSFCMSLIAGRGSPERPGRMLSLEPGGLTQGVALKLPEMKLEHELRILWTREMVTGAYRPIWSKAQLADGSAITAIVFVSEPAHVHHCEDSSAACIAPMIVGASGMLGSNAEYVFRLQASLAGFGMNDAYVDELAAQLRRLQQASEQPAGGD